MEYSELVEPATNGGQGKTFRRLETYSKANPCDADATIPTSNRNPDQARAKQAEQTSLGFDNSSNEDNHSHIDAQPLKKKAKRA